MSAPRIFSYGGGVQSTAALVLAAEGRIDYRTFAFCNVGDDSENPETIEFVETKAKPYALKHGIELVELKRVRRDGTAETLLGRIDRSQRSIPIPVRMSNGAPGNRQCTNDFKIRLVAKELRRRGATKLEPGTVGLGISVDEVHRARADSGIAYERLEYPLLDLRLTRSDCLSIIRTSGLPEPPKSSCWFCPFHSKAAWRDLNRRRPDLFEKSVALERSINEKRAAMGRDNVFFSSALAPLDQSIGDESQGELDFDGCESGYCLT